MRDLPDELLHGPFTVARAAAVGVGEQVLRGRRFVTPFRGVRLPAEMAHRLDMRCLAASLVVPPEAAISHETALQIWQLPTPIGWQPSDLHVTVPRGLTVPALSGLRGHDALLPEEDVVAHDGVRVVRPERTLCDLATEGWAGRRGVLAMRRVLELVDAPVASAMETRVRYELVGAGLPRPVVNEIVRDQRGRFLHRPDLTWRRWKVAVDYDGQCHFDVAPEDRVRRRKLDLRRQERLQDAGWRLKVVTSDDLFQDTAQMVHRVRTALVERGCPL